MEDYRKYIVGGNWKCNGTVEKVQAIINRLNSPNNYYITEYNEVVICIPGIYIPIAKQILRKDISIASQDIGLYGNGAYTGETSAAMLKDLDVSWSLVGHSERRNCFHESNEICAKKAQNALQVGMSIFFCVGESVKDKESGNTLQVCIEQLSPLLKLVNLEQWERIVIAYEPVWAIGTGKTATPEEAEETHFQIREWIRENVSKQIADQIRIIYGGSVNSKNCYQLIACPNIDGFLVGGASLLAEFVDIIQSTTDIV